MSSFKTNIPKSLIINGFNQVSNYLRATNHFANLPDISPDEFSASVLFGGEGDWSLEVDSPLLHQKLCVLADYVAVEQFRVNKGNGIMTESTGKVEDPSEVTGSLFGYDELFSIAAPELL